MTQPPLLSLVEKALAFVDRPWKIAAVVILVFTGVAGLALYEKRAELAAAILEYSVTPRLETDRFPKIGALLLSETGAELTVLAEVSMRANLIKNVDGVRRGDPGWEPTKSPRPLFTALRDPVIVIGLIEGKISCGDVDPKGGIEEQELARLEIKRRCYVAVPPVLDALVGALEIAWRQPLAPEAEAGATRLLYQASTELATW